MAPPTVNSINDYYKLWETGGVFYNKYHYWQRHKTPSHREVTEHIKDIKNAFHCTLGFILEGFSDEQDLAGNFWTLGNDHFNAFWDETKALFNGHRRHPRRTAIRNMHALIQAILEVFDRLQLTGQMPWQKIWEFILEIEFKNTGNDLAAIVPFGASDLVEPEVLVGLQPWHRNICLGMFFTIGNQILQENAYSNDSIRVASRFASVRIPRQADTDGHGYFEDRCPLSNCGPNLATDAPVRICCLSVKKLSRSYMPNDAKNLREMITEMRGGKIAED